MQRAQPARAVRQRLVILQVPLHLIPTWCYVCGVPVHEPICATVAHQWSTCVTQCHRPQMVLWLCLVVELVVVADHHVDVHAFVKELRVAPFEVVSGYLGEDHGRSPQMPLAQELP